jgi:hypothetical protein
VLQWIRPLGVSARERPATRAVVELRVVLLQTVTAYGVIFAREDSESSVAAWGQWLAWLDCEFVEPARKAMRRETGVPLTWDYPAWAWVSDAQTTLDDVDLDSELLLRIDLTEHRERIADLALRVIEVGGEPLGEMEGEEFGAGVALLGAIEDSLELATSDEPAVRSKKLTSSELLKLAAAARAAGVWAVMVDALRA